MDEKQLREIEAELREGPGYFEHDTVTELLAEVRRLQANAITCTRCYTRLHVDLAHDTEV